MKVCFARGAAPACSVFVRITIIRTRKGRIAAAECNFNSSAVSESKESAARRYQLPAQPCYRARVIMQIMSMPRSNPQHLSPVIMATSAEANRWEVWCVCTRDYEIIAWNLFLFWQVVISNYYLILVVEFHWHQFQSAEIVSSLTMRWMRVLAAICTSTTVTQTAEHIMTILKFLINIKKTHHDIINMFV